VGSRIAIVVWVLVLPVFAGCSGSSSAPTSVVRSYEQAIISRNGESLCATFSSKLRQVLAEQITNEQTSSGGNGVPHYDCGSYYHLVIGYPHENVDRQFTSGRLLKVGNPSRVVREGVAYVKVPATLRFEFTSTAYTMRSGEKGAATLEDTVWLTKQRDGKWGVVKPSLGLVAASNPDVLFTAYRVDQVNAAPPDPDYSMTRAERTAWESADYRASFRRTLRHAPLRCGGTSTSVEDPLHDAVLYPRTNTSAPQATAAPGANDIERVTVQATGDRMCVAVLFRKRPEGHMTVGFTPHGRKAFFPTYDVEIDPSLGARGGSLTGSYRYFRGGEKLYRDAVDAISLYGRTVAFAADAGVPNGISRSVPADLTWTVGSGGPTGGDEVPNRTPGEWLVIRQSDGRVVKPAGSR
jgi:hypothetical protein